MLIRHKAKAYRAWVGCGVLSEGWVRGPLHFTLIIPDPLLPHDPEPYKPQENPSEVRSMRPAQDIHKEGAETWHSAQLSQRSVSKD